MRGRGRSLRRRRLLVFLGVMVGFWWAVQTDVMMTDQLIHMQVSHVISKGVVVVVIIIIVHSRKVWKS